MCPSPNLTCCTQYWQDSDTLSKRNNNSKQMDAWLREPESSAQRRSNRERRHCAVPEVSKVLARPLHRAQETAAAGTGHASEELYTSHPFSARPVPRPPQPLAQPGLHKTGFSHPTPKADRLLGLLASTYHGCSCFLRPRAGRPDRKPIPQGLHNVSPGLVGWRRVKPGAAPPTPGHPIPIGQSCKDWIMRAPRSYPTLSALTCGAAGYLG